MKFECDSCHAQYMIADEKLGSRGVKVKCKRCQHVIIVRPGQPEPVRTQVAAAPSASDSLGGGSVSDAAGASDELRDDDDATVVGAPRPDLFAGIGGVTPEPPPPSEMAEETVIGASFPMRLATAAEENEPSRPAHAPLPAESPSAGDPDSMTAHDSTAVGQMAYNPAESSRDDRTVEADAPSRASPPPTSIVEAAAPALLGAATARAEHAPERRAAEPAAAFAASPSEGGADLLAGELAGAFGAMFASPDELPPPQPNLGVEFGEDSGEAATVRAKSPLSPLGLRTGLDQSFEGFGGLFNEGPGPAVPEPKDDEGEPEWHAAIDEEDVGPLTLGQLRARIHGGDVDQETLVWREGMDDWTPAGEVREVRALFSDAPRRDAPRAATPSSRATGAQAGAGQAGWSDPSDPFGAVGGLGDSSEGSWQPHGLTAVYQAANLAEAAAVTKPPPAPAGRKVAEYHDDEDISWKPGAGNALASLVSSEIGRMEPPFSEASLPPAADDSLALKLDLPLPESAQSFPESPGLGGAPLMGPAAMPPGASVLPLGGITPPGLGAAAFAAPPVPPHKNPIVLAGLGLGALFLFTMFLIVVKLFMMETAPVVAQAPVPVPAGVPANEPAIAAAAVATAPSPLPPPAPSVPSDAAATPPAEGPGTPPTATAAEPPEPAGATAAADAVAGEATTSAPESASAPESDIPAPMTRGSSGSPVKKPRATQTARKQQRKPRAQPAPAPAPAPSKSRACDPVLDLDCDERPTRTTQRRAQKTTLTPSDVLGVIKQNKDAVDGCAARYGAKGTLKMEWRILKSGNTSSVRVASSAFVGTPVGSCVEAAVKKWKFPAYSGDAPPPVKFPFKLKGG